MRTAQQLDQAFKEMLVELRASNIFLSDQFLGLIRETLEAFYYTERELVEERAYRKVLWKFYEAVGKAQREFEDS